MAISLNNSSVKKHPHPSYLGSLLFQLIRLSSLVKPFDVYYYSDILISNLMSAKIMGLLKDFYIVSSLNRLYVSLSISSIKATATLDISGEGIYTGQLRGMTFHGCGTYESYLAGGTSYEGYWKDGVFHGQGTLTFANGSKLVGEFVDGSIHGIGQTICPDGHVTEIDFGDGSIISDDHQGCDHDH